MSHNRKLQGGFRLGWSMAQRCPQRARSFLSLCLAHHNVGFVLMLVTRWRPWFQASRKKRDHLFRGALLEVRRFSQKPPGCHGLPVHWLELVACPVLSQSLWRGGTDDWVRLKTGDLTFTFHFHALEKEMATHSSVLAWRIPGTAKPGGLSSMKSHRVGHD